MNTHDKNTLVARDAEETIVQLAELGKENGYKNALAELTVKQITEILRNMNWHILQIF